MPKKKTKKRVAVEVEEGLEGKALVKAVWKGAISLGLVNIPVKVFSITRDHTISFRLLHKKDKSPIKYKRVCEKCGKEVSWDDIEKGFEITKGEYIVLKKEELDAVKPESSDTIKLDAFVDFYEVDPHYLDKTYALLPDKSDEAYSVLLKALEEKGKAALGRVTMRTKEYPLLLHSYKGALVFTTLRYLDEIMNPKKISELRGLPKPSRSETDLAATIIDKLTGKFDLSKYKDEYKEAVEEMIKKKMKGEIIKIKKKPKKAQAKNLMEALKKTVRELK